MRTGGVPQFDGAEPPAPDACRSDHGFDRAKELVGKNAQVLQTQEFLGYRGCLVFAESPCFRQERFTGGRYVQNMSPSRALGNCPVCGGSFEAVGPGGVLVHLLAFHPHSAEAHWVIDQLAHSDPARPGSEDHRYPAHM